MYFVTIQTLYMQIASRCNIRGILALDSFGNSSSLFLIRRGSFTIFLSGRHANSKMFIDKAYASKCCRATDIYRVKVVEEMCTPQLICVRNDRRVEREAMSKGAIINSFEAFSHGRRN